MSTPTCPPRLRFIQCVRQSWTNSASEIGDRVETNRKPEDIQRQMDNVKNALQEREKRHVLSFSPHSKHSFNLHSSFERQGATVDQIIKEVNTTKDKLERAQKDYKQMLQLNKVNAVVHRPLILF